MVFWIYALNLNDNLTHAKCQFPTYLDNEITNNTRWDEISVRFKQFPINISHARTVHKLQGRTITYLLISSWNYGMENWMYIVLPRCRTLDGLHTRLALDQVKTKGMSDKVRSFYNSLRTNKKPPQVLIHAIHNFALTHATTHNN